MKLFKLGTNKPFRRVEKIWTISFGFLGVILLVQMFVANALASEGGELAVLEAKAVQLSHDNLSIQEDLAKKTALVRLSGRAQELGLVKPGGIVYLDLSNPVAVLPQ